MTRRRLDAELVRRGLATTAEEARAAVDAGRVTVRGITATKVATMVAGDVAVAIVDGDEGYLSRAGEKLAAALDRFGVDPSGRDCLDAGASTGGFTDVLLQRGAARVIAVDVGYGQFAWRLRTDPRVTLLERTNVRSLTPDSLRFVPSLLVADLSFVSLASLIHVFADLVAPEAEQVLLVKPQFETDPGSVEPGGVVRDPGVWRAAIEGVVAIGIEAGLQPHGVMASPVRGPSGNVEFLLSLSRRDARVALDVDGAIREGEGLIRR